MHSSMLPPFPTTRLRRLRRTPALREMLAETRLSPSQLVLPLFIRAGRNHRKEVASMPGVFQLSVNEALHEAEKAWNAGIRSLLLFGIPTSKDPQGSSAWSPRSP
ncbi:MAG: porphobilinogen synthase, partial [Verrucomicrobia bacterium]|nr:porphobilinogen synthase [Verrucomicrobiota bacterium]